MLNMVEFFNLYEKFFYSVEVVYLMVEVECCVFVDWVVYLGDIDFYDVFVDFFMSWVYFDWQMVNFDFVQVMLSDNIIVGDFQLFKESFEIIYILVVDVEGWVVFIIIMFNFNFGFKVWV